MNTGDVGFQARPLRIVPSYIRGVGGRETERLRGVQHPEDRANGAESWIGSTIRVDFPPENDPDLGCSKVYMPDGGEEYLYKLIHEHPQELLGSRHIEVNGLGAGVLVKLLDASNGYNLQCHPTREWAKKMWAQDRGKAESWYVIAVRDDSDEAPYVLLGFKEGASREEFEKYYHEGNKAKLEEMCHRVEVHPGDSFFIGGGVPHKLGKGILVIEVQEPQDITMLWMNYEIVQERFHVKPSPTEELYDARLLGSYIFEGMGTDANLKDRQSAKRSLRSGEWGDERVIVGPEKTDFFSFTELNLAGDVGLIETGFPRIAIVLDGEGDFIWENGRHHTRKGDEWFIPYSVSNLHVSGNLRMILCNPEGAKPDGIQ